MAGESSPFGFGANEDLIRKLALGRHCLEEHGPVWCHAVSLEIGEALHCFARPGLTLRSRSLPGGCAVLRVGGGAVSTGSGSAPPFVELRVYPDGQVPSTTYIQATHEFMLLTDYDWDGPGGAAPATAVENAWKLIMSLRTRSDDLDVADRIAQRLVDSAHFDISTPTRVAAARSKIDTDWRQGRQTGALADHVGVSESYLCRAFRKAYSTTITNYSRVVRAARAAGLLWGSATPLSNVAAACGFADQSHLSREIAARFGTTPVEFRKLAPCIGKPQANLISMFEIA